MRIFDHATLHYLAVNGAALKLYGYTHTEFLELTAKETRHPGEHSSLLAAVAKRTGYLTHWVARKQVKRSGEVFLADVVSQDVRSRAGRRGSASRSTFPSRSGCRSCCVKPLDISQILPAIETALSRAAEMRALREKEEQLSTALPESREASVAIGLLMERHLSTVMKLSRRCARVPGRSAAPWSRWPARSWNPLKSLIFIIS